MQGLSLKASNLFIFDSLATPLLDAFALASIDRECVLDKPGASALPKREIIVAKMAYDTLTTKRF